MMTQQVDTADYNDYLRDYDQSKVDTATVFSRSVGCSEKIGKRQVYKRGATSPNKWR